MVPIFYYIFDNIVLCIYVFFFFLISFFTCVCFCWFVCLLFWEKNIVLETIIWTPCIEPFNFFFFLFLPFDIKSTRSPLKMIKTKHYYLWDILKFPKVHKGFLFVKVITHHSELEPSRIDFCVISMESSYLNFSKKVYNNNNSKVSRYLSDWFIGLKCVVNLKVLKFNSLHYRSIKFLWCFISRK